MPYDREEKARPAKPDADRNFSFLSFFLFILALAGVFWGKELVVIPLRACVEAIGWTPKCFYILVKYWEVIIDGLVQ